MTYQLIIGPLVGGVIGYFTNWLAIKMLFRPHTPKYVLGMHIPFTPGIIPKEKYRIAEAIGKAISVNLMNEDVLQRTLLSDEITQRMDASIKRFLDSLAESDESLRDFLAHYITEEDIKTLAESAKTDIGQQVQQHLTNAHVGEGIAHMAVGHVLEKMKLSESQIVEDVKLNEKSGIGDFFKKGVDILFNKHSRKVFSDIVNSLAAPVETLLAKNINEMMEQNAAQMTSDIIGKQADNLLDRSMKDLLKDKQQQMEQLRGSIMRLYKEMILNRLPHMLETINISRMIENRINEMEMDEAERIILDVMDKELKWLVWLGAILGFIIGFANTLTFI